MSPLGVRSSSSVVSILSSFCILMCRCIRRIFTRPFIGEQAQQSTVWLFYCWLFVCLLGSDATYPLDFAIRTLCSVIKLLLGSLVITKLMCSFWCVLILTVNSLQMGSTSTANERKIPSLPTQASRRIHCHQSAVRAARFNSDGMYCMTAGGDKTIKLWNPYTCRLLKTYTGHGGEVSDVRVSH